VTLNLPVEVITGGKRMRAVSQDLSPYGMFVRLSPPLPDGAIVQVVIAPNGQRHVTTGQVTHTLAEVPLASLLQMFETEKKTGQLAITRDQLVAWIDFVDGRIVRARSSEVDGDAREVVMRVLDWRHGYFELATGAPASGTIELDSSVTHLLLAHAQRRDEAGR
jgi:hypothetical protein